jgi:hypothetical protein
VWYYVLLVFVAVESLEVVRLVLRVKEHGWREGVLAYRVTQWSRNFTFGMFYAFTLQLPDNATEIDPVAWMPAFRSLILTYGPYAVLLLLLIEFFIYVRHRFREDRSFPGRATG